METLKKIWKNYKWAKWIIGLFGGIEFSVLLMPLLIVSIFVLSFLAIGGAGSLNNDGVDEEYRNMLISIQSEFNEETNKLVPISYIFASDCVMRNNDYTEMDNIYIKTEDLYNFLNNDSLIGIDDVDLIYQNFNYTDYQIELWFSAYTLYSKLYIEQDIVSGLYYPLSEPYEITGGFEDSDYEAELGKAHKGVDFVATNNNWDVYSAYDGTIITSYDGCAPYGGSFGSSCGGGYGNYVVIEHEDPENNVFYTLYGHLAEVNVDTGDIIKQGQKIGLAGNSGSTTGRHLHFELRIGLNDKGHTVDPIPYFGDNEIIDIDKIKIMESAKIDPDDYKYVDYIVSHESGWDYKATNSESGAYGLCQALPPEKMASAGADYLTNPETQMKWCNSYALERYKSWENAYNWWIVNHWW